MQDDRDRRYKEALDYLFGLQWHGIKLGLDKPRELMRRLGNPESGLPLLHVAGTNGKGSTCATAAALLTASGLRTGLFTSPHLISFTERISLDRAEITEPEVIELAMEVRAATEGLQVTFFEVVTAMGMLYFKRHKAECAVLETGLGGRLDATNIFTPLTTVITPLGMDHREFLGETLAEVAYEKAGIIKPGLPVVTSRQPEEALPVIEAAALAQKAPLHLSGREFEARDATRLPEGGTRFDYHSDSLDLPGLTTPLSGLYQADNAALALRATGLFLSALGLKADFKETARKGLQSVRWPGRLQLVAHSPDTYVDGAHNAPAALALAAELKARGAEFEGMTLVIGIMKDKDMAGILCPLLPQASTLVLTAPAYGRAARPEELAALALSLGYTGAIETAPTVASAMAKARALGRRVLVTGSFYTAGEALEALGYKGTLTTLRESGPR